MSLPSSNGSRWNRPISPTPCKFVEHSRTNASKIRVCIRVGPSAPYRPARSNASGAFCIHPSGKPMTPGAVGRQAQAQATQDQTRCGVGSPHTRSTNLSLPGRHESWRSPGREFGRDGGQQFEGVLGYGAMVGPRRPKDRHHGLRRARAAPCATRSYRAGMARKNS
jgi:hypothetical protein